MIENKIGSSIDEKWIESIIRYNDENGNNEKVIEENEKLQDLVGESYICEK